MAELWFTFVKAFSNSKFTGKKVSLSSLFELYKSQELLKGGLGMEEFLRVFNTASEHITIDKYFVDNYITSVRALFPGIVSRKKYIL